MCAFCKIKHSFTLYHSTLYLSLVSYKSSTKISSLHVLQRSTMLSKHLTPASIVAQCHFVWANQAPGSIYPDTFLCDILRILFAFRSRAPNPCHSAINVDCRHGWRTSTKVTIAQGCAREDGRGRVNMRLPQVPSKPSTVCSCVTGRSWKGWKFSSTWEGSSHTMMPTPRPCGWIWERHKGAGLGSWMCCGLKMFPPEVWDFLQSDRTGGSVIREWNVEFAPVEHKTTGGVSHSGRMANVQPLAREETLQYMVVPLLGGCAEKNRSGDNCPLYGRLSTNCGKFHC